MALKEVAFRVERKVETEILSVAPSRNEKVLACVSSNEHTPRQVIRRAYRIASRYNTSFFALFVRTRREGTDTIDLASQRHLLHHLQLVTELGGTVLQVDSDRITETIIAVCREHKISTICMGQPALKMPQSLFYINRYRRFLRELAAMKIDLIIIAS